MQCDFLRPIHSNPWVTQIREGFWKKCLLYSDVFNLEDVCFSKNLEGIIIGRFDGGLVYFHKDKFESVENFLQFKHVISNVEIVNKNSLDRTKSIYIHGKSYSIFLFQTMFLIVWLGLLSFFYLDPAIEYFSALEMGALTKSVREGGDIYRIFSTFFLHVNILHVLSNTIVFVLMVESLSRLVDKFRLLTTIFFAAFIGSVSSLYLSPHEYVIGASGGIVGLFGAYCVVKFTKNLPGSVSQRSNKMVVAIVVIQLITEYFIDGIDSYTHVGGFLAGAFCMVGYLYFSKAQSIYNSTIGEKGFAVVLTVTYLWGLLTFLSKVYA